MSGYRAAGARAIRIDMLERLADMLRAEDSRGGFEGQADMLSITGMTLEQFSDLMQGLGYNAEKGEREKVKVAPAVKPDETAKVEDAPVEATEVPRRVLRLKHLLRKHPKKKRRPRWRSFTPSHGAARVSKSTRTAVLVSKAVLPKARVSHVGNLKRVATRRKISRRAHPRLRKRSILTIRLQQRWQDWKKVSEAAEKLRADKWLWQARFFKTRSLSANLYRSHLRVNSDKVVKASATVKGLATFSHSPKAITFALFKSMVLARVVALLLKRRRLYRSQPPQPRDIGKPYAERGGRQAKQIANLARKSNAESLNDRGSWISKSATSLRHLL